MQTLELQGRLNRPSNPPSYSWTTEEGIEVVVADRGLIVRWPGAADEPDNWGIMQARIDSALYAATLASDQLAEVQWNTRAVEEADGRRRVVASLTAGAVITTPLDRLDLTTPVPSLDTSMELYFATSVFREGLRDMLADDLRSAMRSFYIACEAVVLALQRDGREADWLAAAETLGLPIDQVRHLYLSLQFARHANPSRAREKLEEIGLDPLTAPYCRALTGQLLRAFASSNPQSLG